MKNDEDSTKVCTKCGEDWPEDFYALNGEHGRRAQCNACRAEQMSNIRRLKCAPEAPVNPLWKFFTSEWNSTPTRS
jgi:hypothetical protein